MKCKKYKKNNTIKNIVKYKNYYENILNENDQHLKVTRRTLSS